MDIGFIAVVVLTCYAIVITGVAARNADERDQAIRERDAARQEERHKNDRWALLMGDAMRQLSRLEAMNQNQSREESR